MTMRGGVEVSYGVGVLMVVAMMIMIIMMIH